MARYAYYVDSAAGSDSTGDGSQESPWQTISHAMTNLAARSLDDHFELYLNGSWNYASSSLTAASNSVANFHWIANPTAELILDATTTRALFSSPVSYMSFRGITFTDVWWNQINCGLYCNFFECKFVGRSGTNAYSVSGSNITLVGCTFEGAGILGSSTMLIRGCKFLQKTGRTISIAIYFGGHGTFVDRCRFYNFATPIQGSGYYGGSISHCSFFGATTAIGGFRGLASGIVGNLFENCATVFSVSGSFGTIRKNASYGHTTLINNSALVTWYESPTVLAESPFADPENDDWTPSAEAAALKVLGQTYGAFAGDVGGGGGYYNPFRNPVFGG